MAGLLWAQPKPFPITSLAPVAEYVTVSATLLAGTGLARDVPTRARNNDCQCMFSESMIARNFISEGGKMNQRMKKLSGT
jgi:hypothetical protein